MGGRKPNPVFKRNFTTQFINSWIFYFSIKMRHPTKNIIFQLNVFALRLKRSCSMTAFWRHERKKVEWMWNDARHEMKWLLSSSINSSNNALIFGSWAKQAYAVSGIEAAFWNETFDDREWGITDKMASLIEIRDFSFRSQSDTEKDRRYFISLYIVYRVPRQTYLPPSFLYLFTSI